MAKRHLVKVDWAEALPAYIDNHGKKPFTTSYAVEAKLLGGISDSRMAVLVSQLRTLGALKTESVWNGKTPHTIWTFLKGGQETYEQGEALGLKWGNPYSPITAAAWAQRIIDKQHPQEVPMATVEKVPDKKVTSEAVVEHKDDKLAENDGPFESLRRLRRDEANALIESARQYAKTKDFIDEEVQRFAQHGIKFDPSVIGLPRDERLETITLVLPVIERLLRENERLSDYAGAKIDQSRTIERLEEQVKSLTIRLEDGNKRYSDLLSNNGQAVQRWSGEKATLQRKIENLEQENFDLRKAAGQINGAPEVAPNPFPQVGGKA